MKNITVKGFPQRSLLLFTTLLVGCSFYSSAGRKQFEEKAPTQITAQAQTAGFNKADAEGYLLVGCRQLGSTEAWFVEELSQRSSEVLAKTALYEIRGVENTQHEFEVTAVVPLPSGAKPSEFQSCKYLFPSRDSWLAERGEFLQDLLDPVE